MTGSAGQTTGERKWIDFCSYHPDFPIDKQLKIIRVDRDDEQIKELEIAAIVFDKNVNKMICTGASVVGGLTSLMQLIPEIPADLDASLFVVIDDLESVEHARSFAAFLNRHSELTV